MFFKKYSNTYTRYFIYFLCFTLFIEIIGNYPKYLKNIGYLYHIEGKIIETNYWWYNLNWILGSTFFYIWYFKKVLKSELFKRLLNYATILCALASFFYLIFYWNDFFSSPSIFLRILNMSSIVMCSMLFFFEILKSDHLLVFYYSINFYISSAIFIWWLSTTPLMFFEVYSKNSDWNFVILKWTIKLIANIFMYLTFTFALIFCKPQDG